MLRFRSYVKSAWSPKYWLVRVPAFLFLFLLFVASNFLPALEFEGQSISGLMALVFGWAGIVVGHVAWFANIAWGIGHFLFLLGLDTIAFVVSLVTGVLALSALYTLPAFGSFSYPAMGARQTHDFIGYEWGFWLWLLSMLGFTLAAFLLVLIRFMGVQSVSSEP